MMHTYQRIDVITFRKNADSYGMLSNMYPMPITYKGITWRSTEHLYQALKFPNNPAIQDRIRMQPNAYLAKQESRKYTNIRPDWNDIRVQMMELVLRLKYEQQPAFKALLLSTGTKPIVEDSWNDRFWGAVGTTELTGQNVLGRLLMKLRGEASGT